MEKVKKQGMESLFCPYDLALELKELGFNEECIMFYRGIENELVYSFEYKRFKNSQYVDKTSVSAPLWQQAFKWLYQELGIEKGIIPLDIESQQLLLKELIDKLSSKCLLV